MKYNILLIGGLALVFAGLFKFIIEWQLPDPLSVVNLGFILGLISLFGKVNK